MMTTLDWTAIVLAVVTLLGQCAWLVNARKDKQEAKGMAADTRQKDMELSKAYVQEWKANIAEPLQREVEALKLEVNELRNAIQRIDICPHRDNCPVLEHGVWEHEAER